MSETDILHLINCRVVLYDWLCLEVLSPASLLNATVAMVPLPTSGQDQGGKCPMHLENPSLICPSVLLLVSSVTCLCGGFAV